MPTVTRTRRIAASREDLWRVLADPYSLPRWWPRAQRVEEVSDDAWTLVLTSDRGKPIRADYSRTRVEPLKLVEWEQELAETPFERILSLARVTIELDGEAVTVKSTERLRGLARLGGFMVRRATRKRLDDALAQLAQVVE